MAYILVGCVEFERDRLMLLDDVCRIVGAIDGWMNFGERMRRERWQALLLGNGWRPYVTE